MKMYAAYIYDDGEKRILKCLRQGWSIKAGIFSLVWALYHKMWFVFIIGAILALAFLKVPALFIPTKLFMFLFFSLYAEDLREWYLQKDGYDIDDIVMANNEDEAVLKYLSRSKNPEEVCYE